MDYELPDSSGTDDDLPHSHQNRLPRGIHVAVNGRSVIGSVPYSRMQTDIESQIHHLEKEAYCSVLRAFKAQSDAITWEKEDLITELRKELRVSDDEHRELLTRVNGDDIIRHIREWRAGRRDAAMLSTSQTVHDTSPTVSASRKRQKTYQSVPSLSLGVPSPALHPHSIVSSMQPSHSNMQRGVPLVTGGKKPKPDQKMPGLSSMRSMQYPSTAGRGQFTRRNSSGARLASESHETALTAAVFDPLVGRKVLTRWPEDNNFYEAVIADYNPLEGRHSLVYDIGTANETWEWVDIKEISAEDIRWVGEDPGIFNQGGPRRQGPRVRKSVSHGDGVPSPGRGRGSAKGHSQKELPASQNGSKKASDDIEILHTDTLIKEVEKVFGASHPDPLELDKAKKMLKDHEQALVHAIAKLADASDGESDGELPFSYDQAKDRREDYSNRQYDKSQHDTNAVAEMEMEGNANGSEVGAQNPGEGGVVPNDQLDDECIDDI